MGYKISVIVPCYNAVDILPRAMASLRGQTLGFAALQVLLVDDCSTDGTWALLQQYAGQYPNVVALQTAQNSGYAGAPRNLALAQLATPYVMFLDNDDAFAPDACETLYREAEASGADVVTGFFRDVAEDGTPLNACDPSCGIHTPRKVYTFPADYDKMHEVRQIFWCKLYRTAVITANTLRFKTDSSMEDVLFLAAYLLHAKKMVFLNHHIYDFTVRSTSLSHSHNERFLAERARDYALLWQLYADAGQPACFDEECRAIADHYLALIFTSGAIQTTPTRLKLLAAWQPLVELTLTRGLYLADDTERALFEDIRQGRYETVCTEFPLYLLRLYAGQLDATQKELGRINDAYQGAVAANATLQTAYNALQADRDSLQAKLNHWPLYRAAKWGQGVLGKK
ncbi:MAG: glycosyltransferase family 2 protein [Gemmiger sp.]|nr:glycosyltransferase family 2 protein [Gemmiger sp.]